MINSALRAEYLKFRTRDRPSMTASDAWNCVKYQATRAVRMRLRGSMEWGQISNDIGSQSWKVGSVRVTAEIWRAYGFDDQCLFEYDKKTDGKPSSRKGVFEVDGTWVRLINGVDEITRYQRALKGKHGKAEARRIAVEHRNAMLAHAKEKLGGLVYSVDVVVSTNHPDDESETLTFHNDDHEGIQKFIRDALDCASDLISN